ncbi:MULTISPECIES: hypothetical protein [unclassified Micromonospora]|uniref:hypothetical protein n=1 Tax=unclassified Micromonospora TaxID=2617518 RepID=UPI00363B71E4
MSKSIPASSIHLNMTQAEITDRVMDDEESSQAALLSAIELSSGWDAVDVARAREAFADRVLRPDRWRQARREFCQSFAQLAAMWQRCAR